MPNPFNKVADYIGGPDNKFIGKKPVIIVSVVIIIVGVITFFSLQDKEKDKDAPVAEKVLSADDKADAEGAIRYANYKNAENEKAADEVSQAPAEVMNVPEPEPEERPETGRRELPKRIEPLPADPVLEKQIDPRFDEYRKMRTQNFQRAITSSVRGFNGSILKRTGLSQDKAPENPDLSQMSYNERMAYLSKRQAELNSVTPEERFMRIREQAHEMSGNGGGAGGASPAPVNGSGVAVPPDSGSPRVWSLNSSLEQAKSLTLYTGAVVPAVLITGVNSDLPGSIIAQVSQNVYDTATGRYMLIPQGTKLYGVYSSQILFGQERVMVAWNRLIYPDGRAMDLGSMPGADMAGYSGYTDQVNNHYWKLFKSAFLLSMVTASVTYADNEYNDDNNDGDDNSASSAMAESLGNELGSVTVELIRKHMNIAPTLEIRNGYRFNVIVTKDLSFPQPYVILK